ncbi:hypothetical protein C8F01DRAFT_208700 [Mycena amicta]|nr:hypothetical protein C8F01DRAFT_208700 [Mycena amicta]
MLSHPSHPELMIAPAGPGLLSQKQRRRLFRLFRDEIIVWLCCLRTSISVSSSRQQPMGTSGFLIAVEPLPANFPFSVDTIRRRFPIADTRRPDRRVNFDVELEFRPRVATSEPMVWVLRMTADWNTQVVLSESMLSDEVSVLGIFEIPLPVIEDAHRTFAIDADLVLEGISCSVANSEHVYLLSEISASGWPTQLPNASAAKHKVFSLCTRNKDSSDASRDLRMSLTRQLRGFTKITPVGEPVPLKPCAICNTLLVQEGPSGCSTHSYSGARPTRNEQRPGWIVQTMKPSSRR